MDVFPVNATVDNEGLQIDNSYLLESIVEYSEKNKILYVRLVALPETYVGTDSNGDTGVYAINVGEKRNRLIAINWFNYNKKDK